MGNWQKITIKDIGKTDEFIGSKNLIIELSFKQIRKAAKKKEGLISKVRSSFGKKEAALAIWLVDQKSDEELQRFLLENEDMFLDDIDFLIYSFSKAHVDLKEDIRKKSFVDLKGTVLPRDYEKTFNFLANAKYRGVTLDVEDFKRAHIILAHKFGLDFAITGIIHDRHEKSANSSDVDIKVYG